MHRYALKIRKSDLPLLTLLNGNVEPPLKPNTYLVFSVDGDSLTSQVVSHRTLLNLDFNMRSPLLLKLNK